MVCFGKKITKDNLGEGVTKLNWAKKNMLWTSVIDRFQQQRFWAVQWGWTSKTEHGMLHDLEGFPLTIIEHMDFQGDIWIPIQLSELSQTLGNYI